MALRRWKVTLILDIEETNPRKFIPETIAEVLEPNEDLVNYEVQEIPRLLSEEKQEENDE